MDEPALAQVGETVANVLHDGSIPRISLGVSSSFVHPLTRLISSLPFAMHAQGSYLCPVEL
jgi:hypothetical protein